ncbi:hypothetical protein B0H12DRAFT_1125698 [Mycena haematopus]|nr:hypothetical protein B0H12DRAFT_1125698 [Mycena haematopus]
MYIRRAAINCLSRLSAQVAFQDKIRPAIPGVVQLLADSEEEVREAAIGFLPSLGEHDTQTLVVGLPDWELPEQGWMGVLASLPQLLCFSDSRFSIEISDIGQASRSVGGRSNQRRSN